MKYFTQLSLLTLFLALGSAATAQSDIDALRYSRSLIGGTARGVGVGSAFGALGGDLTCLGINPAGLGLYRSSELNFTPGVIFNKTKTDFAGNSSSDDRTRFIFPNAGFVIATEPRSEKWPFVNLGFAFNRSADFNQEMYYTGETSGSIVEMFQQKAIGTAYSDLDPFYEQMAYDAYLIDNTYNQDPLDYDAVLNSGSMTRKAESLTTKGGIDDIHFGLGANYKDKLYLGFSITGSFLHYRSSRIYSETDESNAAPDNEPDFESMSLQENLRTRGAGVSLKFGGIVRATRWMRFGLAIHTPTWFRLNDEYSTAISSEVYYLNPSNNQLEFKSGTQESPAGKYDYTLRTPAKAEGSVAFILGTHGFISADLEWVNYGASEYEFQDNAADQALLSEINQNIQRKYANALNARIGGEFAFDIFRLRAGYGFYSSPFKEGIVASKDRVQTASVGFGIREESFYLDLAYRMSFSEATYSPYTVEGSPNPIFATNRPTGSLFMATVGFKF